MRKKLTSIKESWCRWCHLRREQGRMRRHNQLTMEAERRVSVMAWGGEVYLAVDGVPVLPAYELQTYLPESVEMARSTWVSYHEREEGRA